METLMTRDDIIFYQVSMLATSCCVESISISGHFLCTFCVPVKGSTVGAKGDLLAVGESIMLKRAHKTQRCSTRTAQCRSHVY